MNHIILTGASRGLGLAMAKQLLKEGNRLICMSRHKNEELVAAAQEAGVPMDYLEYELESTGAIDWVMEGIFKKIDVENARSISLINNAGMLAPVGPVENGDLQKVMANIHINLLAPMLFTAAFIRHTSGLDVEKRIINISSGAGKHPYFGWSSYCTSKAGLDMFTRCVATEQESKESPVKILSIAPGVVDTDMQEQIRNTDKENFPHVDRFIKLKEEGKLLSPDFVAEKIIGLLFVEDFAQGAVLDIKELM